MIDILYKLRLRKKFRIVFNEKLKKIRRTSIKVRLRKVRKFSSSFLFRRRKKKLNYYYDIFNAKLPVFETDDRDYSFIKNRFIIRKKKKKSFKNFKSAYKAIKSFSKFKKIHRYKKTSRNYRAYNFFTRKLKKSRFIRANPLTRFYRCNLQLLSFNYSYLLNFHTAIGNNFRAWINPSVFSKILAIRNDMILYDLSFTFIALKKGLQSVFQVSKFRGTVLGYINLDKYYKFSGVGFDHFLRSWLPGYLTNFKKVLKNIFNLQTNNMLNLTRRQKKFLRNIYLKKDPLFNREYYFERKMTENRNIGLTKIPSVPSFGFSLDDFNIWVNECQKVGVRTMVVCDSESFLHKIDFPLVGNQKSLPLSFFLVKMVSESVFSGKRSDYFSFAGFKYIYDSIKRIEKADDRLLKKMSFTL